MERTDEVAVFVIPALDHFDEWPEIVVVIPIRFFPYLDVLFRVSRDPPF